MDETKEEIEKEPRRVQIKDDADSEYRDLTSAETATCIVAIVTPLVVTFIAGVAASDKVKNGFCRVKNGIGNLFTKKPGKAKKKDDSETAIVDAEPEK